MESVVFVVQSHLFMMPVILLHLACIMQCSTHSSDVENSLWVVVKTRHEEYGISYFGKIVFV